MPESLVQLRSRVLKQVAEVARPDALCTREEYVYRLQAVCDVAVLLWSKIQCVELDKLPEEVWSGLSQAATDGMTKWAREHLGHNAN